MSSHSRQVLNIRDCCEQHCGQIWPLISTLRNFCIASVKGCIAALASHCRFSSGKVGGIDFDFFLLPWLWLGGSMAASSAGVGSMYTAAPFLERKVSASAMS